MTQEQKYFINRVGNAASADMARSGVLASMKTAQAILESGWGRSGLAIKANALFGIKADSRWSGRVFDTLTQECYDGINFITVNAAFRAYDSWEHSIADHSDFLTASARYAKVIGETDYITACRAIHAAGYATDPDYSNKLINIIQQYNLNEFDTNKINGGEKMKITLDPGHGERGNQYPPKPGFFEGTQMWKLAQFMTAGLEKRGFEVITTRPNITNDPSVNDRGAAAAKNGSVMFYSLHSNAPASASQTTVAGSEIFISVKGAQFKQLAEDLLNAVCKEMGHNSRGVKTRSLDNDPKTDWLGVIRAAANGGLPCAMLMEHGFHTNPRDAEFLTNDDNLKRLAEAQAEIIAAYFGTQQGAAKQPPAAAVNPPAASKPTQTAPATPAAFKEGDIVQFTGGGVYVSSTAATPAHSRGQSRCKVTRVVNAKQPYHLISEDSGGVHGWVSSVDVAAIGKPPAAAFVEYRVRVNKGTAFRAGPGNAHAVAGTIADGGVFTIIEEQNGWGRLKSGAGWLSLSSVTKI